MNWSRQASAILLSNSVAEGLQFLLKIVTAGILGPQIFGLYTLLQLIPQYAEKFFRFGVDDGVTYLAGKSKEKSGLFFFNSLVVLFVTSVISMVLLWSVRASFVSWVLKDQGVNSWILVVTLLQIPSVFVLRASTKRLLFLENISAYNVWSYGPPLFSAIGLFVVALIAPKNLLCISSVVTLMMTAGAVGSIWAVYRLEPLEFRLEGRVIREILHYGRRLYIPGVLGYMHYRADVLLLGIFLTPTDVGVYALAATSAQIVYRLATVVASLLYARTSREESHDAADTAIKACRYTFLCSTISVIPVLICVEVAANWLLPQYHSMLAPFYWLLPAWLIVGTGHVLQHHYYGVGKPNVPTQALFVAAIVNVVINIFLIPSSGVVGAAIASFASYLLFSMLLSIVFLRRYQFSWKDLLVPRKSDLETVIRSFFSLIRLPLEGKTV